jgi:hypothetical protein
VTEFYNRPVAVNMLGYINFENPNYVLDLSGISSETARQARARQQKPDWMDDLLANHNVGLAIIDATNVTSVPTTWTLIADLHPAGLFADDPNLHYVFYARRPDDIPAAAIALDRFAPTLPAGAHMKRNYPDDGH